MNVQVNQQQNGVVGGNSSNNDINNNNNDNNNIVSQREREEEEMSKKITEMMMQNNQIDLNNPVKYQAPMMDSKGSSMSPLAPPTPITIGPTTILSPNSEKKARRFSLYVYQHPTDEQKQHISELYGYKAHNEDSDQGYAYAHDSNESDEGSSDSYSSGGKPRHRSLSKNSVSSTNTSSSSFSSISPSSSNNDFKQSLLKQSMNNNMNNNNNNSTNNLEKQNLTSSQDSSFSSSSGLTFSPINTNNIANSNIIASIKQQEQLVPPSNLNSNITNRSLSPVPSLAPYAIPPTVSDNDLAKVKTLEPPDRNQLPKSYLSHVQKSAYAEQQQQQGATSPYSVKSTGYMADEYDEKQAILKPPQKVLSTAKDWNAEFQTLVNSNRMEGYREISKLAHDFVYTAKIYGKVIISELTLPLHLKTIKPINIGGVAGGHKYIALGILFKLALDSQGLYAGDQNAMKAAGHELKGLMSYYNTKVEGLHHPLMALIDYRGYRLVAMSLLPINSDTIVYGSSDGGITVHCEDSIFNEKMRKSAKALNLKGHMVGKEQSKLLHSCGDIEGHIGSDGLHYLLDFARVFPPIVKINDNSPPSHLYELIRPELVKSNKLALSSDALTGWGKFDSNSAEHNYEVKEASYRLFLHVIPKFAVHMDNLEPTEQRDLHLTQELHRVGINCRYLGLVRRQVYCTHLRKLIMGEILARTMRCEIMQLFRGKMKSADTPSEEPFKEVVVHYFNTIFSYQTHQKGKVWPDSIKKSIAKKFIGTFQIIPKNREVITFEQIQNKRFDEDKIKKFIRSNEYEEEEMLVDNVDIQWVMKRFSQLTGVALTKRALREITKNDDIRLVQSDVKRMKAKVKAHHLVEFAEGMVLWDEAKHEKSRESFDEFCPVGEDAKSDRIAERLMSLADEHFRNALAVSPHSGEVSANWALMLVERARMARMCNPENADTYYDQAEDKLRASVCDGGKPKITLDNVLLEYAEFLCINGTHYNIELDMSEANGLRSKVFSRASKKIIEAIRINPSKFPVLLQKTKFIEKGFHNAQNFKESAAFYAGCSTVFNCLIQAFDTLPASHHLEIAEAIIQNLSPIEMLMQEKEVSEMPDLIHRSLDDTVSAKNYVSKRKDEAEIKKLLEKDPLAIIRIEMGCAYIRYGYLSHVYGIMCSKRNHTKMASIKLLKKSGTLFQKGIDFDPYNRDVIIDHIKRFTSSSQFVEFYQSAIGCPSVLDFLEDRLLRIAHMSLKNCSHLPIEFIEGIIEYSPRVKMLVLDGCHQITDSTIALIVKKLSYLETLSLSGCVNVTTIVPTLIVKEYQNQISHHQLALSDGEKNHGLCSSNSLLHSSQNSGNNSREGSGFLDKKHCIFSKSSTSSTSSTSLSSPIAQSALVSSLNNILLSTSLSPSTSIAPTKPLTFLQNLNLNKCKSITDEKVIGIANMQLPLVNVYFKKCNITDASVIHLTLNCPKIAILELSGCKSVGDPSVISIANNCLSLRELSMNKCPNVTSNSIDKLFRQLHDIRSISLAHSQMAATDNTLRLIGKYCPSIQIVNLSGNHVISDSGIINMTKFATGLLELNITQCTAITDVGINQIAQQCSRLRILRMAGLNNVTSLKPIGSGCPELVELDISECHKISSDLGYITKGCPKLSTFRLRRCYGLQDVSLLSEDGEIHSMPKLTILDWSYGNIEFQTIHSITHSCKHLTSLNISYCKNLTDTSIERIASSLSNLKTLKFDSILNITDEGIKALSEGSISSSLQVFSIVGCRKISDISAHHILKFNNLRKISLGGCLMTTNGVNLIASESFELVKIRIRYCLNINPTIVQEKHPHILVDTTQKDSEFD